MNTLDNPIVEALASYLRSGRQVLRLHTEPDMNANKRVTFYFEHGTPETIQTSSDFKTFLKWWRHTGTFIEMSKRIKKLDKM